MQPAFFQGKKSEEVKTPNINYRLWWLFLQKPQVLNMDEAKFRRLRQIILDSTTFISGGISFDTFKALKKGYSEEEITDAEYLLTKGSFYTRDFLKEIRLITTNTEDYFAVYFVEFAKIVFVLYEDSQKSMHFFEEDLQKIVSFKQYLGFCDEFLLKKPAA